jgi:hypothetical protein
MARGTIRKGEPTMHRLEKWKPRIDSTRSEGELLAVMKEYCNSWLPSELALLPEECQECRADSATDLTHFAVDLKRADLVFAGPEEARTLLQDMSRTFTHAAERLRIFHHPAMRPAK